MLAEVGLVPESLAATIAAGIETVVDEQGQPDARRSSDYLVFEARLVEVAGRDASRLHTGRSRQDIGSTFRRLSTREALLDAYESLLAPRDALLTLAEQHTRTIIPAYTHGVQAQPTSLAHYLLALASGLERDAARFEEAYARVNLSPLGAAALGTSGFPLDRERLADLLGFDGAVVNSYDANHISSVDSKTEVASALSISAVTVGQFSEDVHTQYHDPVPWLLLDRSLTGISSIMPQKRNPSALEQLRRLSSTVIGDAQTVFLIAHNTNSGMTDYRSGAQLLETLAKAATDVRAVRRHRQRAGGQPQSIACRSRRRLLDDDRGGRHAAPSCRGAVPGRPSLCLRDHRLRTRHQQASEGSSPPTSSVTSIKRRTVRSCRSMSR